MNIIKVQYADGYDICRQRNMKSSFPLRFPDFTHEFRPDSTHTASSLQSYNRQRHPGRFQLTLDFPDRIKFCLRGRSFRYRLAPGRM